MGLFETAFRGRSATDGLRYLCAAVDELRARTHPMHDEFKAQPKESEMDANPELSSLVSRVVEMKREMDAAAARYAKLPANACSLGPAREMTATRYIHLLERAALRELLARQADAPIDVLMEALT